MMPDLSLDADERLLSDGLTKLCAQHLSAAGLKQDELALDLTLWRTLCAQEIFALGTPLAEGGARLMVACAQALGSALFPGPVAETFLAAQVLDGREREEVVAGRLIVSAGQPPTLPFADVAQLHLGLLDDSVRRLAAQGEIARVPSLGAHAWGRADFLTREALPHAPRGLFFYDVASCAYLTAAARSLLSTTAAHVATRKQFGRTLGSFQAVGHPLADLHIALSAAEALPRAAAAAFDEDDAQARRLADAALVSSRRAALETAYVCHQKLGAIGITLEGPAHYVTRRLRELSTRAAERSRQRGHTLLLEKGHP